jgi:hypothetical protein
MQPHDFLLKAAEIREVAKTIAAPALRKELLMIAAHYERLAGLPRDEGRANRGRSAGASEPASEGEAAGTSSDD